jgi:2-C-methyl-D-erythritol 4-phosphate cytidylyltransferase/2-C-methyl-D-erythritol 2,4-cyclodiphosphate synthase
VVDTVKRVSGDRVREPIDRSELAAAQTPQGFRRTILDAAYAAASAEHTDDAALVQSMGTPVWTVPGDERSFKITTRATSTAREPSWLSRRRTAPVPRVGVGTDVHAVGGSGDLWLAGLHWPGEPSLHGHSDGDAVAHAIVDAVLAAAGLGDIGTHFGTDQPQYAGAHAEAFLARTRELVAAAGRSATSRCRCRRAAALCRAPRGSRTCPVAALGAPVAVSATTTDGLGYTGTGDGVAAFAVALVYLCEPPRPRRCASRARR